VAGVVGDRKRKSERQQRSVMISVRFAPFEIEIVQALAGAAGKLISAYLREVALAGAERPAGLIEGSGRVGEPVAFPSSLSLKARTISCPHFSVGNVTWASCGTCGLLGVA